MMCDIINRTLRNKFRKETNIKFYNMINHRAAPVLLHVSETCTIAKKLKNRKNTILGNEITQRQRCITRSFKKGITNI